MLNKAAKTLSLRTKDIDKKYGVKITYINPNKNTETCIHYPIKLFFRKEKIDNEELYLVKLQREEIYINNQKPKITSKKLITELEEVIYPLIISINSEGNIKEILNLKRIAQIWKKKKEILKDYYSIESLEKLFDTIDNIFKNVDLFKENIKKNLFFLFYFLPIYGTYQDNLKNIPLTIPEKIFYKEGINYNSEFNIKNNITTNNIQCTIKRDSQLTKTGKNIFYVKEVNNDINNEVNNENSNKNSKLRMIYKLNPDFSIFTIKGFIKIVKDWDSNLLVRILIQELE